MKMTEDEYRGYLERSGRKAQLLERARALKERVAEGEARVRAVEERVLFLRRKRRKQSRAFEKLAKISAMMEDSQKTIEAMTVLQLNEITKYRQPPEVIQKALEAILLLLRGKKLPWDKIRSEVTSGTFVKSVLTFNVGRAPMEAVEAVKREYIQTELWDLRRLHRASRAMGPLGNWLQCQIEFFEFSRSHAEGREVMKFNAEILELEAEKEAVLEAIENDNIEIVRAEEELERLDNELSDSEFVGRQRAASGQAAVQKRVSAVDGLLVDAQKISEKLNLISNGPEVAEREEEEEAGWELSDALCYFRRFKEPWAALNPDLTDRRWSSKVTDKSTQTDAVPELFPVAIEDLEAEKLRHQLMANEALRTARDELEAEKLRHQQMANEALRVLEAERAKHETEAQRFAALSAEMGFLEGERANLRDLEQRLIATLDSERQRTVEVQLENSQLRERLRRAGTEAGSQTASEPLSDRNSRAVQTDQTRRLRFLADAPVSQLLQKSHYNRLLEDIALSTPLNQSSFNETQNILKAIDEPLFPKARPDAPAWTALPKPSVNVVAQLPPLDSRVTVRRPPTEESQLLKGSGMTASKIGVVFQDYFPRRVGPVNSPQAQAFLARSQTPVKFIAPPLGLNASEKLITFSPGPATNSPISTRVIEHRPQTVFQVVRSQTPNFRY